MVSSLVRNCSRDLFRDTSSLAINNFTRDKDGYYWCQLAINNKLVQPSHRALFFAGNCGSTTNSMYFRLAHSTENQCAKYVNTHTYLTTRNYELSNSIKSSVTLSKADEPPKKLSSAETPIVYVAGSLGALVLVFGALVIALSMLFLCKFQNRETG